MAKFDKGILGGFSGKVGTVVGVNFRGRNIMRSLPTKSKRPASPKQQLQRDKMSLISKFLAPVNRITSKFFGEYQGTKSRANLATSHQLLEAITISENNKAEINFQKVVLTKGPLPTVNIKQFSVENDHVTVQWDGNANTGLAKPTDQVLVLVYNKEIKQFASNEEGQYTRASNQAKVAINTNWNKGALEIWIILIRPETTMASTSEYLGVL